MTKTLLLTFILMTFISFCPQKKYAGRILYKVTLRPIDKPKNLEIDKIPNEDRQKAQAIIQNIKAVDFLLIFNNNESIYKVIEKMDSEADSKINLAKSVAGGDDIYYSNNQTNSSFYQKEDGGELWLVNYKKEIWNLTQETKNIGNYLCYKAILGKQNNFAWYAPEIPVNFGPKNYHGLPGLVLEVQIGGLNIKATEIILNPNEQILIKKPIKGIEIEQEAFLKKFKEFFKGF